MPTELEAGLAQMHLDFHFIQGVGKKAAKERARLAREPTEEELAERWYRTENYPEQQIFQERDEDHKEVLERQLELPLNDLPA